MTLMRLEEGSPVERNPFQPIVPDSIRAVSPELYDFLRQLTENIRTQHNKAQAGDTTFDWQVLLGLDEVAQYTPGSEGTFYHESFGIFRARYVKFASLDSSNQGGPLAINNWTASNYRGKVATGVVGGLIASYVLPTEGQFGWALTEGVNLQAIKVTGAKPTKGDFVSWQEDGSIQATREGIQFGVATVNGETTAGGWLIPAGGLRIQLEATPKFVKELTLADLDALGIGVQLRDVFKRLTFVDSTGQRSIEMLNRRITTLTNNKAAVELTERISAAANFASLANADAKKAKNASRLTNVNLEATSTFRREAKVYRDEAGYYSQSTLEFSNSAMLSASDAGVSAESSATFAQTASTKADEAGVSATAAQQAQAAASVSEGNSYASAQASQGFSVTASNKAAEASQSATLAAQYRDEAQQDFTAVNARIDNEEQVRADADSAEATARQTLATTVNGHTNTLQQQAGINTAVDGRTNVYWSVISDLGGGRAGIQLSHRTGAYAQFDIMANVRIYGTLVVDGTLTSSAIDRPTWVRVGADAWTGPLTVNTLNQRVAVNPFTVSLGTVYPGGSYTVELSMNLETLKQTQTSTIRGQPYYKNVDNDGGLLLTFEDVNGNVIQQYLFQLGQTIVLEAINTGAVAVLVKAYVVTGNTNTGPIQDGDYWYSYESQTYRLHNLNTKIRWTAV